MKLQRKIFASLKLLHEGFVASLRSLYELFFQYPLSSGQESILGILKVEIKLIVLVIFANRFDFCSLKLQLFRVKYCGVINGWWHQFGSSDGCCLWSLGNLRQQTDLHYVGWMKTITNGTRTIVITHYMIAQLRVM